MKHLGGPGRWKNNRDVNFAMEGHTRVMGKPNPYVRLANNSVKVNNLTIWNIHMTIQDDERSLVGTGVRAEFVVVMGLKKGRMLPG
jgi:hypothetical protein